MTTTTRRRRSPPDPPTPGGKIGRRIGELLQQRDAVARAQAETDKTLTPEQRKVAGFTGSKLAEETGIPQSRIANLLLGHVRTPSPARLAKIAEALGTTLTNLTITLTPSELEAYCTGVVTIALNRRGEGTGFGRADDDVASIVDSLNELSPRHADILRSLRSLA